jgi:glycerol uptake facilitator-like aquaporin
MLKPLSILVEFLGTFIFASVIISTGNALAIGATLAVLVFLASSLGAGHYNPAVTAMFLFNRGIAPDNAIGFVVAQIAGALLAAVTYTQLKKGGVL